MARLSFAVVDRTAVPNRRPLAEVLGVPDHGPSERGSSYYKTLLMCPREFALTNVANLTPEHPSDPLNTGLLHHLGLERYYKALQQHGVGREGRRIGAAAAISVYEALQNEPGYGTAFEETKALIDGYLDEYDRDEPWEILAIEETIGYQFQGFEYTTRLDLLVRHTQLQKVYIVEHKTARAVTPDLLDNYQMDLQVLGQIWLVERVLDLSKYGKFGGTLINIATKHSPPRFHRHEVNPSPAHLRSFEQSLQSWIRLRVHHERENWPRALGHCAGYARGYGKCQFYGLCHDFPDMHTSDWTRAEPPLGFKRKALVTV